MNKDQALLQAKQKAQEARKKYEKERKKITVRYTKDELKKINEHAEKASQKVRAYIRSVSLNPRFKIIPEPPKIHSETKIQIQKIGVNLNQMARAMNNYHEAKNFDSINQNLLRISNDLHSILTFLRG